MARKKVEFQSSKFFEFLNSQDDLTAIIHGLSMIEALLDEALSKLLTERALQPNGLVNLRIMEKAEVLIVADRLDVETYGLLLHLTRIRNRFAHRQQTTFTPAEGREAFDLLPDDEETSRPPRIERTTHQRVVIKWGLALLMTRIRNRSIAGESADLPYS